MKAAPSEEKLLKILEILDRYDRQPSKLIPILQDVQKAYQYLPEDLLAYVAASLEIPAARVYGVATFYSFFALEPKGKHVIRLCDGTACHVKDSIPILNAIRDHLGLHGKQKTTHDMQFTVETVACLGACGLAPVMVVNEQVHGAMTPAKAVDVVKTLEKEETAAMEDM